MVPDMNVRESESRDRQKLIRLVAEFRVQLASFRGATRDVDHERAGQELDDYRKPRYRVYVAELDDGRIGGYLVCRFDDNVVWAESMYVPSELRRSGIGSALYLQAEELARKLGQPTVYNWVHPNNDTIISFLRKRGYSVLNLVEIRGLLPGEQPASRIQVGNQEFDY